MDDGLDVLVVGAGVVGLAVAAEIAGRGRSVAVLERHESFGRETSSRSSEVVHAGLYYPPGTLKTELCVEGRHLLYDLAARAGVPHRKVGKVIVAVTDDEIGSLEALLAQGRAGGVEGLRMISAAEAREREPAVAARAALLSPETGIVDSHELMGALLGLARQRGAAVVFGATLEGLAPRASGWRADYRDAAGPACVHAGAVVNAAGLGAQDVMRMAGLRPEALGLALRPCKGEYFALGGRWRGLVRGLVYPAPPAGLAGLGIHTLIDLGGGLRLGPNARYVERIDYDVDPSSADAFAAAAGRYLPGLGASDLAPAMAGIRPKLSGPGEPARDFHIADEAPHGAPGFVNLAGIESPGLTAAPAIARLVADLVDRHLG